MNVASPKAYTISDVDSMPAEMTTPLQLSPLRLVPVGTKAVDLDFDGGRLSSDAGLVLLRDPDAPLGFTRDLAAVLRGPRDPRRVHLTLHDLLKQRVLPIAAGYEDANDANTLRVTDCNRNELGLQSARFPDHIICIYHPGQDWIICH